ncbi:MAG: hypothetical protein P8K80_00015 [Phycisphaerales bacterium]|nr:hypothetical protein [Phycisphaerales bacterium]
MIDLFLLADGTVAGSAWPLFGRLHPLLIHFPIAMILTAAAVELVLVVRRDARPSPIAAFCLWVGTVFACLAAWTGWSFGEEYGSGNTLELHRWFGVAAAGVLVAVVVCWCIERSSKSNWSFHAYRFGLWGGAMLIIVTSFFGGEMVWGEGYLFDDDDRAVITTEPVVMEDAGLQDQVATIIEARCASCHGPEKQKDKLQLFPLAKAFPADRQARWVVIPGDPDASKLIQRVMLPADHDDRMPPKGEPLTSEQVDLLKEWITDGAPHDAAAASPPSTPEMTEAPPASVEPAPTIDPATLDAALAAIGARGGMIAPRHQGSPWYELNASLARPAWTNADLDLLTPLEPVLWRLDLGGSSVTDAGMPLIGRCVQLRTLKLDRTGVGDAGLSDLRKLVHLESLNLFGTDVSDAGLPAMEALPALRTLYLWDTKVQAAAAQQAHARRPQLDIELGEDLVVQEPAETDPEADPTPAAAGAEESPTQEVAAEDLPACCRAAEAQGRECDHPCCVKARAQGVVCPDCPK